MEQQPELLVVGKIVAAQGLRGELRVNPLSDFPERFTQAGPRWLRAPAQKRGPTPEPQEIKLLSGRRLPGKELFVIRIEGIDDRSSAEACVGQELLVPSDQRPTLSKGEFHLLDLVGLEVRLLESGTPIGQVQDLLHAGNDLLEVQLSGKKQPLWIPFVDSIVPRVELEEGWIGITPPPGLLELADPSPGDGQS
ncbi:ribosome maturation factor RimM [Synechococcus sp. NB0720_010]|uniref:ribosome maturation factor RimM n=1 Tax=Synechococcus sp. NB0720_010 TaxID=2907159 RepID=UPI001FFB93F2|nr:ribosome maturation factor RimM [Synechococcus sp. NB0720_010]UPH89271.1 ribosome maturation factor RimM [Synechococcus sp. NB0720_010]